MFNPIAYLILVVAVFVAQSCALLSSSPSPNVLLQSSRKQLCVQFQGCIDTRLKRDAFIFPAVSEKINSEFIYDSKGELRRGNISSARPQPSLTVAAGQGASITSVSSDVHIKNSAPTENLQDTSYRSGEAGDPIIPKGREKNVLPLPIVKTLVGRNENKCVGAVGKVMSSIRTVAAARATQRITAISEQKSQNSNKENNISSDWKTNIQSVVSDMLEEDETRQQSETYGNNPPELLPHSNTVLFVNSPSKSSNVLDCKIAIRSSVPHSSDDKYIANLRLSVFSNFDEERQNIFRSRSIEVLNKRRRRGAIALIAEMSDADFWRVRSQNDLNARIASGHRYNTKIEYKGSWENKIVGSVECSQHEFDRTILGNSRPKNSLLYVTEVAVCPEARRCGIGTMLMQGAEEVAALRKIESIYLHVDVTNVAAIAMYEEAGYYKLDKRRPIYAQFTASLLLHDGALMGRCHYLMCKHLTEHTTWVDNDGFF